MKLSKHSKFQLSLSAIFAALWKFGFHWLPGWTSEYGYQNSPLVWIPFQMPDQLGISSNLEKFLFEERISDKKGDLVITLGRGLCIIPEIIPHSQVEYTVFLYL